MIETPQNKLAQALNITDPQKLDRIARFLAAAGIDVASADNSTLKQAAEIAQLTLQ